jgi:dihydroxyacetone kinase
LLAAAPGGVVCATKPEKPKVAVVIGGGSGHYPAFAGLVGPGLADTAAMGNVFASPGARAVAEVARAANAATRTIGVAFGEITLPSASDPLFTVPAGELALGMGIHGEPGLSQAPLRSARLRFA